MSVPVGSIRAIEPPLYRNSAAPLGVLAVNATIMPSGVGSAAGNPNGRW